MPRNMMSATSSRPENRFRFKPPSLPPLQRLELGSNPRTFSNEATILPTELKQMSTESVILKWPDQEENAFYSEYIITNLLRSNTEHRILIRYGMKYNCTHLIPIELASSTSRSSIFTTTKKEEKKESLLLLHHSLKRKYFSMISQY